MLANKVEGGEDTGQSHNLHWKKGDSVKLLTSVAMSREIQ